MTTIVFLILACGSGGGGGDSDADSDVDTDSDTDTETGTGTDTGTDTGTGSGTDTDSVTDTFDIPDPGAGFGCTDDEPNDGPNDAVPCGIVGVDFAGSGALYPNLPTTIGGADLADWFVFRTEADVTSLHQFVCWNYGGPVADLLDFAIYEVTGGGTGMSEVARYDTTDTGCENPAMEEIPVAGNTVYLLEILSVQDEGQYQA